jgi:hypothetical protein
MAAYQAKKKAESKADFQKYLELAPKGGNAAWPGGNHPRRAGSYRGRPIRWHASDHETPWQSSASIAA